jgi:hypothetical protein
MSLFLQGIAKPKNHLTANAVYGRQRTRNFNAGAKALLGDSYRGERLKRNVQGKKKKDTFGGRSKDMPANSTKYKVDPNPLDLETHNPNMQPQPHDEAKEVRRYVKRKIALLNEKISRGAGAGQENQERLELWKREKSSWQSWLTQLHHKEVLPSVRSEFIQDFQNWLMGRGREIDHLRTEWYRTPITEETVTNYLDAFINERHRFLAALAKLKTRAPRNVDEAYLYYKYIARQNPEEIPIKTFLADWDKFSVLMDVKWEGEDHPHEPDIRVPAQFPGAMHRLSSEAYQKGVNEHSKIGPKATIPILKQQGNIQKLVIPGVTPMSRDELQRIEATQAPKVKLIQQDLDKYKLENSEVSKWGKYSSAGGVGIALGGPNQVPLAFDEPRGGGGQPPPDEEEENDDENPNIVRNIVPNAPEQNQTVPQISEEDEDFYAIPRERRIETDQAPDEFQAVRRPVAERRVETDQAPDEFQAVRPQPKPRPQYRNFLDDDSLQDFFNFTRRDPPPDGGTGGVGGGSASTTSVTSSVNQPQNNNNQGNGGGTGGGTGDSGKQKNLTAKYKAQLNSVSRSYKKQIEENKKLQQQLINGNHSQEEERRIRQQLEAGNQRLSEIAAKKTGKLAKKKQALAQLAEQHRQLSGEIQNERNTKQAAKLQIEQLQGQLQLAANTVGKHNDEIKRLKDKLSRKQQGVPIEQVNALNAQLEQTRADRNKIESEAVEHIYKLNTKEEKKQRKLGKLKERLKVEYARREQQAKLIAQNKSAVSALEGSAYQYHLLAQEKARALEEINRKNATYVEQQKRILADVEAKKLALEAGANASEEEKKKLSQALAAAQKERQEIFQRVQEAGALIEKAQVEAEQAHKEEVEELQKHHAAEAEKLQEALYKVSTEKEEVKKELASLRAEYEKGGAENQDLLLKIEAAEKFKNELAFERDTLRNQLAEAGSETVSLSETIEQLKHEANKQINEKQKSLEAEIQAHQKAEAVNQELRRINSELEANVQKAQETIAHLTGQVEQNKETETRLKATLEAKQQELVAIAAHAHAVQEKSQNYLRHIDEAGQTESNLRDEVATLNNKLQRNMEERDNAIRELNTERENLRKAFLAERESLIEQANSERKRIAQHVQAEVEEKARGYYDPLLAKANEDLKKLRELYNQEQKANNDNLANSDIQKGKLEAEFKKREKLLKEEYERKELEAFEEIQKLQDEREQAQAFHQETLGKERVFLQLAKQKAEDKANTWEVTATNLQKLVIELTATKEALDSSLHLKNEEAYKLAQELQSLQQKAQETKYILQRQQKRNTSPTNLDEEHEEEAIALDEALEEVAEKALDILDQQKEVIVKEYAQPAGTSKKRKLTPQYETVAEGKGKEKENGFTFEDFKAPDLPFTTEEEEVGQKPGFSLQRVQQKIREDREEEEEELPTLKDKDSLRRLARQGIRQHGVRFK